MSSFSSASSMMDAASRMQRRVSRIDRATAERLFPPAQRQQWPTGYLPASGIAHLLRPEGVRFGEVLECYADIKHDRQHELQRDFASDYTMWNRSTLEDFVRSLSAHRRRRFTRLTARDRLVRDGEVREVFRLAPYLPPQPPTLSSSTPHLQRGPRPHPSSQSSASTATATSTPEIQTSGGGKEGEATAYYQFQPYAATQEYAMLPVQDARSPQQSVHFTTFPQLRNVLHTDFDSMTALRALSLYCEDGIVYTREMVQALALYLQRRLDEMQQQEPTFLNEATTVRPSTTTSSPAALTFSMDAPIVVFFGNGRLAWMLNESGVLPKTVRAVQLPRQDAQRQRRHTQLLQQRDSLESQFGFHKSFTTVFPCETLSVGDALRKYRPAIAIVEPHVDRDYFSDLRGFYSVREVLAMGPIDSPAMGSFAFPLLSFGATPGPTTYWAYNDNLHKVHASARIQMPMDPPHESQGYVRHYLDDISAYLISPNDCAAIGSQFRCLAFRRVRPPVLKDSPPAQRSEPDAATAPPASS